MNNSQIARPPVLLVFLNGPPGCGKDIVAEHLAGRAMRHLKFADPLKDAACSLMGIDRTHLERVKNLPVRPDVKKTLLPVMTHRDFLIALSEGLVKPWLGDGHFGSLAGRQIVNTFRPVPGGRRPAYVGAVFSDCGFDREVEACLLYLLASDLPALAEVWQIERPGVSFAGDSRGWLSRTAIPDSVPIRPLPNTGSPKALYREADRMLLDLMSRADSAPQPTQHEART